MLQSKLLIGEPAQYREMKLPQLDFPNQVLLAYYHNIQARQAPTINAIRKRVKVLFHVRVYLVMV